jgi:PAS domain S-box-containing protein
VVIGANRALLDASGYAEQELRGRPFSTFLDPAGEAEARDSFTALATGAAEFYRAARRYRTRSGELRNVDLRVSLVRDPDRQPQMCLAVLQDVTEHTRALDELARHAAQLEAVIQAMPAAVYIGTERGITMANRRAVEQLGFESPSDLMHPIPELSERLENRYAATGERIAPHAEPFARAIRGEQVDTEVISRHLRTGEEVVQHVVTAPVVVDGAAVGAVAVNTDITERRRTEEALRLSEARYRSLVEQAPLSIQILSPDGRTLQVNSAWERLWGVTLAQIGDYNMLEDRQLEERGLLPFIRRAFDGEPSLVPASEYDPDQTLPDLSSREDARRWVRAVVYPLKDGRGAVREVVLIHEDITDQVRADEQRREATDLLQLVVQQSGEAIIVADAAGVVRIFNPAAERLYGVGGGPTPLDQWSQHYRLLRGDGTPLPSEETALYRALRGETVRDARWLVSQADGSPRRLAGTAAPLKTPEGNPAGAVLIARDETDRLAAETERERLLVETQRAHREVEKASRMKDEFLATLSHELRTPLNAVLGWARILRSRETDASTAHGLAVIERNAASQARLIDDLLDVSRIITGKISLQMERVDLSNVAAAAIETVRPAADARGVRLQSAIPAGLPDFMGDPQRLQQVLWNLLSNAVKFTDSGGHVQLTAAVERRALVVAVEDTGIGIPADFLPYVFDRFMQGDSSSTRAHSGLGLGLAIVRHLVELHGGTVSAESPGTGHGATFRVRLPLATSPT